jgi:signal transduction histidine kinase
MFRPFAQFDADRSGLGLGLVFARRAAEAMGGAIRVRDVPGTGCVFTVDVPRAR